jgi:hypothetical protein
LTFVHEGSEFPQLLRFASDALRIDVTLVPLDEASDTIRAWVRRNLA